MDEIVCPKCGNEHTPTGSHDEDVGEMNCEACDFVFEVDIDYDPSYTATCKEHAFGDWISNRTRNGEILEIKFCEYCGTARVKP